MITEGARRARTACRRLRQSQHSRCFACSRAEGAGLALEFETVRPGCVQTRFDCPASLQSYDGILHGGVICLLLDAAMTNCGFSLGRSLVTGDLQVRFLHPVPIGESVLVESWVDDESDVLQIVRAKITLNGQMMARAVGKFVDKTDDGKL